MYGESDCRYQRHRAERDPCARARIDGADADDTFGLVGAPDDDAIPMTEGVDVELESFEGAQIQ